MRRFEISAEASQVEGRHPVVFQEVHLLYSVEGDVDPAKLKEAVDLSQTLYCGVSAMIAQAVPIHYRVLLNGKEIHTGSAKFDKISLAS